MADELSVRFWGVRGSHPAPGQATVKYGGNTACVEIEAGGHTLILDAGTGIIALGRELARRASRSGKPIEAAILFSHLHHDHIQGFPFFVPAFLPGTELYLFGPGPTPETLERVLTHNQSTAVFPVSLAEMPARKHMRSLPEGAVLVWGANLIHEAAPDESLSDESVVVRMHRSYAHPGGSYAYRVTWRGRSVVYATDVEGYVGTDRRLAHFARGADLLIHDAQYSDEHYRGELSGFPATQGYGHSTVSMACDTAAAAEAGQLVLFHHDPAYDDARIAGMEAEARKRFRDSLAAYEGLELRLQAPGSRRLLRESERERDVKYAQNGRG